MSKLEQIELDKYRDDIIADVETLVEKYRSIFGWDVPDIDQAHADKIILAQMQKALHDIESRLIG